MDDRTRGLDAGEQPVASKPGAEPEQGAAAGRLEEWQPRLWSKVILLAVLVIYVVGFIVANSKKTEIDFLVAKTTISRIWLVLLCLAFGFVAGLLVSQIARRRRQRAERERDERGRKQPES
ncbi:MAG: lipopolysaccharide assembly protein LapA domain-containing protein [Gaiellaceae bacterium]